MDWRAYGRWFAWPAILLWVVLWHLGPLPLSWHVRRSYPQYADLLVMVMPPLYVASFGIIFGLMHGPPHPRSLWRVVVKVIPLALLAGVLAEALMYPEGLWGPGPLTRDRVLRAVRAVCTGGAFRAVLFLIPMALGAHVARYRLGRYALAVAGVAAACAIAIFCLLARWLVSLR